LATEAITSNVVDQNNMNFYMMGSNEIATHIRRLETTASRTATQNSALTDLKRAVADIGSFPFENTCKLDMYGFNEVSSHPYKINTTYDNERRGDPLHWAFCFYPENSGTNAETELATRRIRESPEFQRVFRDSTAELLASNVGAAGAGVGGAAAGSQPTRHRRYDMRSFYNDDLLNLHCRLYDNSAISAGNLVYSYNDTRLIEITLPSTIPVSGRLPIQRMRLVVVKDAKLFVENDGQAIKRALLGLTETLRTEEAFLQRPRKYTPTAYKFLFHLCDSTQNQAAVAGAIAKPLAHTKMIQLVIPKQAPFSMPDVLKRIGFTAEEETQGRLIYNFFNQRPYGDINDMRFSMSHIDNCIPNEPTAIQSASAANLSCVISS
jgi:hypothetical protein